MAVTDVSCKEKPGLIKTRFTAESSIQLQQVERNQLVLQAIREQIEASAKAAAAVPSGRAVNCMAVPCTCLHAGEDVVLRMPVRLISKYRIRISLRGSRLSRPCMYFLSIGVEWGVSCERPSVLP